MSCLKSITVEPTMFLQMVGDTLTYVIYQNLFINKICEVDLKYSPEICAKYENEDEQTINSTNHHKQIFYRPIMNNIQAASAKFVLYNSLVENCLPVFLVLFLGVWSDAHRRRKPPLLLSLVGKLLRSAGLFLNAWFMKWPPIVLFFTVALPHCLGGANAVFHMASFSYLADSSAPRNRTKRLGIAEGFWQLGSPIGLALGAYLFGKGGYLCVFGTAVLFHLVAVLYTAFVLPEVPQPRPSQFRVGKHGWYGSSASTFTNLTVPVPSRIRYHSENDRDEVSPIIKNNNPTCIDEDDEEDSLLPQPPPLLTRADFLKHAIANAHGEEQKDTSETNKKTSVKTFLVGSLKSIVKRRPNHTRKCLLSLGLIMLFYGITFHGEGNMKYLYTRNRFGWREQQFSNWTTFEAAMVVTGLVILMPIFSSLLKFSDPFAGTLAAFGRFSSRLCIALAPSSEYMYIAAGIDVVGVIGPLSARSLASKCVLRDERGRIFAFLGCIEAIVPLISVPFYSIVYSYTLSNAPNTIYYISGGLCVVNFVIFGILFIAKRLDIVQFTGTDMSILTQPIDRSALVEEYGGKGTSIPWSYRRISLS